MNKRQIVAIVLLVGFVLGIIGVYAGFISGRSEMGWTGLCLALPAAVGSFLLKRDLKREADEQQHKNEKENGEK